jgi:hypothetical protein
MVLLNYVIAVLTFLVLPDIGGAAHHNGTAQFFYLSQLFVFPIDQ